MLFLLLLLDLIEGLLGILRDRANVALRVIRDMDVKLRFLFEIADSRLLRLVQSADVGRLTQVVHLSHLRHSISYIIILNPHIIYPHTHPPHSHPIPFLAAKWDNGLVSILFIIFDIMEEEELKQ